VQSGSLGTLAVLALTAAASPFSLVAFSLLLATDRGTKNGIAFILGWLTTIMLFGVAALIVGGSIKVSEGGSPTDAVLGFQIALGVVLLLMWFRRRLRGPVDHPVEAKPEPAWQRRLTSIRSPGSFVLGGAVQTWPVMIGGVLEITSSGASTVSSVLALFLFACATATGIVILEVLAWRHPGSAADRLDRIRNYVDEHRYAVLNWIMLGGGVWLIGRGLVGLAN
jgi:Sap, sulfolipid-1-addressing protein